MGHVFEPATSGRAKCRGCGQPIPRGMLRFGVRLPNAYGDGEMTLWFHPLCAAYKLPEPMLEALGEAEARVPEREALEGAARGSAAHRRLPRIDGAERARSGQAKCRDCHEPIERGSWRLRLTFYEEGLFSPGGFLHMACRESYFEGHPVLDAVLRFSPDLEGEERDELTRTLAEDRSA